MVRRLQSFSSSMSYLSTYSLTLDPLCSTVHPQIGGLVDCTSNYESEADEMKRKSGMELTPELWLLKLLMGGIDSSYDEQDEA
jgi:hypothetical protein